MCLGNTTSSGWGRGRSPERLAGARQEEPRLLQGRVWTYHQGTSAQQIVLKNVLQLLQHRPGTGGRLRGRNCQPQGRQGSRGGDGGGFQKLSGQKADGPWWLMWGLCSMGRVYKVPGRGKTKHQAWGRGDCT